ncbi:MAG: M12 family metallo-peptidase [Planctomycetota bacterium]
MGKLRRKLRNLGSKIKRGAKKAGSGIKKAAKKTGSGIKKAAKKTGSGIKKATRKTGSGVRNVAKKTGSGVKKAARKVGGGVKRTARKTGSAIKTAAVKTGGVIKRTARRALKLSDFNLKLRFVITQDKSAFPDAAVEKWIKERVRLAEKIFAMKPRLKIKYEFVRRTRVNGKQIRTKVFDREVDYSRFMNRHFDNSAKGIVNGCLVMLVVDDWKVAKSRFKKGTPEGMCGKAFFPRYPGWRKHAVVVDRDCAASTFVHELGHVFGLRHTFEKGGACTTRYKKGESGKGATRNNGRINVMDYRRGELDVFLNKCQEKAAAFARRRYMLPNGKVNYLKLKGI